MHLLFPILVLRRRTNAPPPPRTRRRKQRQPVDNVAAWIGLPTSIGDSVLMLRQLNLE